MLDIGSKGTNKVWVAFKSLLNANKHVAVIGLLSYHNLKYSTEDIDITTMNFIIFYGINTFTFLKS